MIKRWLICLLIISLPAQALDESDAGKYRRALDASIVYRNEIEGKLKVVTEARDKDEVALKNCASLKTPHNLLGLTTVEWAGFAGFVGLVTGFLLGVRKQ